MKYLNELFMLARIYLYFIEHSQSYKVKAGQRKGEKEREREALKCFIIID